MESVCIQEQLVVVERMEVKLSKLSCLGNAHILGLFPCREIRMSQILGTSIPIVRITISTVRATRNFYFSCESNKWDLLKFHFEFLKQ